MNTPQNDPPGHGLPTNIPSTWTTIFAPFTSLSPVRQFLLSMIVLFTIALNFCFFRLASVLSRDPICRRPPASPQNPSHLLIVLGSGGHTAEMLNILNQYDRLQLDWTQRTYVVSSGDDFSASRAQKFEADMRSNLKDEGLPAEEVGIAGSGYDIVTVHRARRVHQPLLTTPISSLRCLWECIQVLRGTHPGFCPKPGQENQTTTYPDLILTNGPGTGVIVTLASIILLFLGLTGPSASLPRSRKVMRYASTSTPSSSTTPTQETAYANPTQGQMRTMFIESWARVKTLSLSGRLLKPFVDRFLVQWPQLEEKDGKLEFVGGLVT